MSPSEPNKTVRRARPALGTVVEIRAVADEALAWQAIDQAFAELATCERLMSAHTPDSDLGRIAEATGAVSVDWRTWAVLDAARAWWDASGGAFDVTVGSLLAHLGYLPAQTAPASGNWHHLQLLPESWVQVGQPVRIDLGGIAKGYAVDRAVAVLREAGVAQGCVNAGGDLRVFGDVPEAVQVRDPADPARLLPLGELADAACATSAPYFSLRAIEGQRVTPVVDPRARSALHGFDSVSVIAPTCMQADALTKIVLLLGEAALPLLQAAGAQAICIDQSGSTHIYS